MYGIIINHLLYLYDKGAMVKYSKYLKIIHIFTFWHNNGFILIAGIVSINIIVIGAMQISFFLIRFISLIIEE